MTTLTVESTIPARKRAYSRSKPSPAARTKLERITNSICTESYHLNADSDLLAGFTDHTCTCLNKVSTKVRNDVVFILIVMSMYYRFSVTVLSTA